MKGDDMATVDFTLEELLQATDRQTRGIVKEMLAEERLHTQGLIKQALIDERPYTRQIVAGMIQISTEDIKETIATEFLSFWDHNLEPVLSEMQADIAALKRAIPA
jgi:uncharacterized protein YwbE